MCTEPVGEVREAMIQGLPDAIIQRVRPPERLMYNGPRRASRRDTARALNLNRYCITELEQIETGYCLTLAEDDHCSFVIDLGGGLKSDPLHFVKVVRVDHDEQTVTWDYFVPTKARFSHKSLKYFSKSRCAKSSSFQLLNVHQTVDFNPDNIVLGWDLEPHEKKGIVPEMQYLRCGEQIKVIAAARRAEGLQDLHTDSDSSSDEDEQPTEGLDFDSDSSEDVPLHDLLPLNRR